MIAELGIQQFELGGKYIAFYRIDNASETAHVKSLEIPDRGILYVRWRVNPVPSDAKEFAFTVTQLGSWKGWIEFKIGIQNRSGGMI
jgi:hypothetical protein